MSGYDRAVDVGSMCGGAFGVSSGGINGCGSDSDLEAVIESLTHFQHTIRVGGEMETVLDLRTSSVDNSLEGSDDCEEDVKSSLSMMKKVGSYSEHDTLTAAEIPKSSDTESGSVKSGVSCDKMPSEEVPMSHDNNEVGTGGGGSESASSRMFENSLPERPSIEETTRVRSSSLSVSSSSGSSMSDGKGVRRLSWGSALDHRRDCERNLGSPSSQTRLWPLYEDSVNSTDLNYCDSPSAEGGEVDFFQSCRVSVYSLKSAFTYLDQLGKAL